MKGSKPSRTCLGDGRIWGRHVTAIRSPRQLRKGFSSVHIPLSPSSLSGFTLYLPPQSYRQIRRTIKGNTTWPLWTCASARKARQPERGRKRGLGSFIFPNTNLIAVLKRLNCLAFAVDVLLYYVKSLSLSGSVKVFRGYRRIVHLTDSSIEHHAPCVSMAIESTPYCAEIKWRSRGIWLAHILF